MKSWDIVGAGLSSAWQNRVALFKIWLTTSLIIVAVAGVFQYLSVWPDIRYSMATEFTDSEYVSPFTIWDGLGYVWTILSTIFSCGLMVNSYRYLFNRSHEPSWKPFNFDWSATFAVFGYALLVFIAIIGLLILASFPIGFCAWGVSMISADPALGISGRFGVALFIIGVLLSIALTIFAFVYGTRASLVLVSRSLGLGYKYLDVLRATKNQSKTVLALISIIVAMFLLFIYIAIMALVVVAAFPWLITFFLPVPVLIFLSVAFAIVGYFLILFFTNILCTTISLEMYKGLIGEQPKAQEKPVAQKA